MQSETGMLEKLEIVEARRKIVLEQGGAAAVEKQHSRGKLTARERIDYLADAGSFLEVGAFVDSIRDTKYNAHIDAAADGVVTGTATMEGRPVAVIAWDFTTLGGSLGTIGMGKIVNTIERGAANGMPIVCLFEGGGHRIQDGLDSRHFAHGSPIWRRIAEASGWVPIVSAILGPGFAAATNFSAMADFVIMVEGVATMGMAGPALVRAGTGEDLPALELGGAALQVSTNGIAHLAVKSERDALDAIKKYLSYLPSNAQYSPPKIEPRPQDSAAREQLLSIVPESTRRGYDMRKIVKLISDVDSVFEIQPTYGKNIVTAFGRLDGAPVGFIGNQPMHQAGMIDTAACDKASHFIAVCDAFGLPLVYLIDTPGFAIGSVAERAGISRRHGRIFYELGIATVPRMSVVIRKGYGGAFVAMNGGRPSHDADIAVMWPSAEVCAMSIEGAVDVAYRRDFQDAVDPQRKRQDIIDDFRANLGPLRAAEHFYIDDVIDPRETARVLSITLKRAASRRRGSAYPRIRSISPI